MKASSSTGTIAPTPKVVTNWLRLIDPLFAAISEPGQVEVGLAIDVT